MAVRLRNAGMVLVVGAMLALLGGASPTTQSITWRTSGVHTVATIELSHNKAGEGMTADAGGDGLDFRLSGRHYADVQLLDRIDYDEDAVLRLDVASIKSGELTLQVVCYDDAGKTLQPVDVLQGIDGSGAYEVPFRIYRTPLRGAKQISFTLWLSGKDPSAAVASIAVGSNK